MEFNKSDTIYVVVAVTVLGVALLMLCLSYVSNLLINSLYKLKDII